MTLSEWLKADPARTVTQVMRLSGLSYVTVLHARDGVRKSRPETIRAICRATGGAVTKADFEVHAQTVPHPTDAVEGAQ